MYFLTTHLHSESLRNKDLSAILYLWTFVIPQHTPTLIVHQNYIVTQSYVGVYIFRYHVF